MTREQQGRARASNSPTNPTLITVQGTDCTTVEALGADNQTLVTGRRGMTDAASPANDGAQLPPG